MGALGVRFWSKVSKGDYCWQWEAAKTPKGYGVFVHEGKAQLAHRLVLENGGLSVEGKVVRHSCDNPSCVRPSHLRLGSYQDNSDDMVSKGRQAKGTDIPQSKLQESHVSEIKWLLSNTGAPQQWIADRYGINQSVVSRIKRGLAWSHVTVELIPESVVGSDGRLIPWSPAKKEAK